MTFRLAPCLIAVAAALGMMQGCAPAVVGAAATAGVAAAEERGIAAAAGDTRTRAQIGERLFSHDHKLFMKVTTNVSEGRVLLTGTVPSEEARDQAGQFAWQAGGVREVYNELQIDDGSSAIDYGRDVVIANTLRSKLLLDKQIRNINYNVETVNGVVYLLGIAQNQEEKDRVVGHARNIANVRRVVDYILLKDDPRRHQSP